MIILKGLDKLSIFDRIKEGLAKTRRGIAETVGEVFKVFRKVDESLFDELEEALIVADAGADIAAELVENLRGKVKSEKISDAAGVKKLLAGLISEYLAADEHFVISPPQVILLVGVNGAGKTTTAGKLAERFSSEGHKVILAAADTFRAAAIDQLVIWGERTGCPVIRQKEGADPAAVVFDAVKSAKARKSGVLICDTAGRLNNKTNLMKELGKIHRVIEREYPEASVETLIALDATTGQNALRQAADFKDVCGLTGVVLTKLDGTAKGGVVIAIKKALGIPVRYVGVGESAKDLLTFDAEAFSNALFDGGE